MKKAISIILSFIIVMVICSCGGNVSHVNKMSEQSAMYTEDDIQAAMDVTMNYFNKYFKGCTLTELVYAGDEKSLDYIDWAERNGADEVIVFLSSFDVDASGGDGSLNPNSTYENWNWILVRKDKGAWQHVDHGY